MFYYQDCNRRLGPQEMNYHFSISLKNNFFFCQVAKAGCSAVKTELWRQEVLDVAMPERLIKARYNPHAPFEHHLLIKPFQLGRTRFNEFIRDNSVLKWAVVRNPFTRALSGYLDKVQRNEKQFANIAPQIAQLRNTNPDKISHKTVTFEEFCEALALFAKPQSFDQHWRPQYEHICADIIPYSFTIKLEDLENNKNDLARKLGLTEMKLDSGRKHATGANYKLGEHYSDRCIDIIRKVYANDFEHFNYSLEFLG